MKTIAVFLLLSGVAWAHYDAAPQTQTEAIYEVTAAKALCSVLKQRKVEMDAGKKFPYTITQADIDDACNDRLPTAEANLAKKVWLRQR